MSNSLQPHGLYIVHGILQARILEWVAFLLQGIFPAQCSNPSLPHCRWILYQLSQKGSPHYTKYVSVQSNDEAKTKGSYTLFKRSFDWASQVALVFKNPPAKAGDIRDADWIPGRKDPLEEGMATHSRILAWRIPWTEEPGRAQRGLQRVRFDWSNLAHAQLFG